MQNQAPQCFQGAPTDERAAPESDSELNIESESLNIHLTRYLQWPELEPPCDTAQSHALQREQVLRIQSFLKSVNRPFHRETRSGHITGSAVVFDTPRAPHAAAFLRHTCLMHHAKLGIWLMPGGHSDGDPCTWNVALNESFEETGLKNLVLVSPDPKRGLFPLDVDIHVVPSRGVEPAHLHYDIRYLVACKGPASASLFAPNAESLDLGWYLGSDVAAGALAFPVDESVRRLGRKLVELKLVTDQLVS
jgi:8-oxo-dGTP pyrophosphatase MutT (NUDIX family)